MTRRLRLLGRLIVWALIALAGTLALSLAATWVLLQFDFYEAGASETPSVLVDAYEGRPEAPSISAVCHPDGILVGYHPATSRVARNVQVWADGRLLLNRTDVPDWFEVVPLTGLGELRYAGGSYGLDAGPCAPPATSTTSTTSTVPPTSTSTTSPPSTTSSTSSSTTTSTSTTVTAPPTFTVATLPETGPGSTRPLVALVVLLVIVGATLLATSKVWDRWGR